MIYRRIQINIAYTYFWRNKERESLVIIKNVSFGINFTIFLPDSLSKGN